MTVAEKEPKSPQPPPVPEDEAALSGRDRRRRKVKERFRGLNRFWQRISEGLEVQQLWEQFHREAHASYELYRKEVDWTPREHERGMRRAWRMARDLFWVIVMKLSPARRVMLLLALGVGLLGAVSFTVGKTSIVIDIRSLAFAILLVLLVLELADRVTMKRDLEIAREIQHWLVPESPPVVAGLDIAFVSRPANTVGGDYYDAFFPDPKSKRLLLAMADVAGKSVPAAILMATFQASLHSFAQDSDDPLHLAERLNDFACTRSMDGRRFTTAFLAELNVERLSLRYVNAGHNFPVLKRATGKWERLERGGLPFGIDAQGRYESDVVHLEKGDLLFIFTDGLVEAIDPSNQEFGDQRMLEVLGALRTETAAETIGALLDAVDRFRAGARRYDDITCLAVRVE